MSDLDTRCLDAFPEWLRTLGADVAALFAVVDDTAQPESVRRRAATAVNYLFRSLDLIPDGIEDLGFIDDAFVFRAAAALALNEEPGAKEQAVLERLSDEAKLVAEFLGDDYQRLETFVDSMAKRPARGRSADEILESGEIRAELGTEVRAWADSYVVPGFTREQKTLVKLRSFLSQKLPNS